jgi:hypothetical protein
MNSQTRPLSRCYSKRFIVNALPKTSPWLRIGWCEGPIKQV